MNDNLLNALRNFGGSLTDSQIVTLRDMQGWIQFCIDNGISLKSAVGVLSHDVNGILANEPGFSPKVSGYAKHLTHTDDLSGLAEPRKAS